MPATARILRGAESSLGRASPRIRVQGTGEQGLLVPYKAVFQRPLVDNAQRGPLDKGTSIRHQPSPLVPQVIRIKVASGHSVTG
jgi:hypothetical protein